MGKYVIRSVSLADLEQLYEIEQQCFPAREAAGRESLKERILTFPDSFLAAESDGRLIGFINGAVTDGTTIKDEMFGDISLHNPKGAYQCVFGLDVLKQHRSRGIAGELMGAFIKNARARGRRGVILTCKDHLIGFYERFGYVNKGVSESVHGGAVWYDMILEF